MQMIINNMEFTKRTHFSLIFQHMKQVIAKHFTNGDMEQAVILLEGQKNMISSKDVCIISFLMGVNLTILLLLFIYIYHFTG